MYKHPNKLIDYFHTLEVLAYNPYDKLTNQKAVGSLGEAGFFVNVLTVNKTKRQKCYLLGGGK